MKIEKYILSEMEQSYCMPCYPLKDFFLFSYQLQQVSTMQNLRSDVEEVDYLSLESPKRKVSATNKRKRCFP